MDVPEELLAKGKQDAPISGKETSGRISVLVDRLTAGDRMFLELVAEDVKEEFEPRDLVNTAILAIEVGIELGYNKSKLVELGTAALLHDVGIGEHRLKLPCHIASAHAGSVAAALLSSAGALFGIAARDGGIGRPRFG